MKFAAKLASTWRFLRYGPTRMEGLRSRLDACESELAGARQHLEAHLARAREAQLRGEAQVMARMTGIEAQFAVLEAMMEQLSTSQSMLDAIVARQTRASPAPPEASFPSAAEEAFYPVLEAAFRGSPEDVRRRLGVYRSWIDQLPPGPVGDLGCGRGEWLELLRDWGRDARGVDSNPLNAGAARAQGLDVVRGDALQWLQAQAPASHAALTLFHVVEHLSFAALLALVAQANRVIKPGGFLIMETPNPENLLVATQTFWLDPTHQRPIPPQLLELVATHCGLAVEATLRLHPPVAPETPQTDAGLAGLLAPGRDYAVVARKRPASAA